MAFPSPCRHNPLRAFATADSASDLFVFFFSYPDSLLYYRTAENYQHFVLKRHRLFLYSVKLQSTPSNRTLETVR